MSNIVNLCRVTVTTGFFVMSTSQAAPLRLEHDEAAGTISVYRADGQQPILTQHARPGFRPYIHPMVPPDGRGVLTEYQPDHHPHQTGLYWGFTRVNGRDYFHHPGGDYWRRVGANALQPQSAGEQGEVQWQTVYDLIGPDNHPLLRETQVWTMREGGGEYVLDLEWTCEARTDVTIGQYDYGGLFLRMPWREGMNAEVVNAARQRNRQAEGQRSPWLDIGLQVAGRDDRAHIAIFDHPKNRAFPQPWRVDQQMGVGPVPARLDDWQLARGERAVLKHRLLVYTGKLNDLELTEKWSQFSGQRWTYVLWGLARQEGRNAEFLTPEESVARMTLPEGFQVNAFAAEPMIAQPMAFCWDDRGRLWIAENRDYETRQTGFANSGDSRILILEDADGDGTADRRQVFLDRVPFPSGIAVGFDGLWLGTPPNLLFVPDRDGDDVADRDEIEVRLTGWGIRDRHETLNSFTWGPDGWLYGCQGLATPSRVGKPAGRGRLYKPGDAFPEHIPLAGEPVDINAGIWRYHPTKERFEVVAHGFSNPWGIDFDKGGQMFITACVIPHLWHVIPGGCYHRQGGQHFNPYVYSDIQTIADHRHRSAHGGARIYMSDAFPQRYHNRLFMANIHEHAVLTDVLERRGSGFVGRHGDDFMLANNAQWIGFSVEIGPEGAVYVLDWHDADICGMDVLNKDTGRVYRIAPVESHAKQWNGRYRDLATLTDAELVDLQLVESAWHARRARLILQAHASRRGINSQALGALKEIYEAHPNAAYRLRALWGLHVTGALPDSDLTAALADQDEHIRAWAIQLLCEDATPSEQALVKFAALARDDPSPVVRLYLAAALQRITLPARWSIASELVAHGEDAQDHNIPVMLWLGIEPLVPQDPSEALELANRCQIPSLRQHIARRLTDGRELETLVAALAASPPHLQRELLRGMRAGLEGQFDVAAPDNWSEVYSHLQAQGGDIAQMALELAQQFGDTLAAQKMLATLKDDRAAIEERRRALQGLAGQRHPELKTQLVPLLDDQMLRRDTIRAMAAFDDDRLADELLQRYPEFSDDDRVEAVHTLASRSGYGWQLTQAIQRGHVRRQDVPAYVARLLRRVVGSGFVDVWGPIDELSVDKEAAFTRYRALLSEENLNQADPRHGRLVFKRACLACHKLYGNGGLIGPELTGSNRGNLEYLLGNVLTPSAVIQDAYKMHLVLTHQGRIYSGVLAGQNERHIQLRVVGQQRPVVIARSEIESREIAPVSMMPEGLLTNLTDAEVLDLIAYLRTPHQVALPETVEP